MFWGLFKSTKEMTNELDKKIKEIVKPYEDEIIFLQSMQRLDVQDGDILILKHPGRLSKNIIESLQDAVKDSIKKFGHDINVMVLEENMDIGVLRKESKTVEPEMFCVNCDAIAAKPIAARYGKYCNACGNILNTSLRIA